MTWFRAALVGLFLTLVGCGQPAPTPTTAVSTPPLPSSSQQTAVSLPPTFTPPPPISLPPSPTPFSPTAVPTATTLPNVDFDQTVVEMRFTIPAIGLDRRLEGKLGGAIIAADEASGVIVQRSSQGNIVAELRQLLPTLALEPVPADCANCVTFSYNLPAENSGGNGWLQEARLLASVENYFRDLLGPHFPADAVVGLHRAPSPYAPAHTVWADANGRLWQWLATDAQILPSSSASPTLLAARDTLDIAALATAYRVDCVGGVTPETLHIQPSTAAPPRQIGLLCPEFSLPNTLQPLYLALDAAIAPRLAQLDAPQRPPARFPLAALLDYRRADGAHLLLLADGRVGGQTAVSPITATLTLSQTTALVQSLLASGELQPGLTSFADSEEVPRHQLLVRGPDGVVDGAWPVPEGEETAVSLLAELDALLAQWEPAPTPTVLPTPTP